MGNDHLPGYLEEIVQREISSYPNAEREQRDANEGEWYCDDFTRRQPVFFSRDQCPRVPNNKPDRD